MGASSEDTGKRRGHVDALLALSGDRLDNGGDHLAQAQHGARAGHCTDNQASTSGRRFHDGRSSPDFAAPGTTPYPLCQGAAPHELHFFAC